MWKYILSLGLVVGCGVYEQKTCYTHGDGCHGNEQPQPVSLRSADPSSGNATPTLSGPPGSPGAQGTPGPEGRPGQSGLPGAPGTTGASGSQGSEGRQGTPGQAGGTGPVGPPGPAASPPPFAPVGIIDPCGKQNTTGPDAVILQLGNGQLLWHFSDGGKQYLGLMVPGQYDAPDGTGCHFVVNTDLTVSW